MSSALPESMREYIDNRVAAGSYGNAGEYAGTINDSYFLFQ